MEKGISLSRFSKPMYTGLFFTVILLTNSTLDKTVLDRRFTTKNENKKSDANNFVIV